MPLALECSRSLIADDAAWLQPNVRSSAAAGTSKKEGPTDDEVAATVEPRKIWKRVRKHAAEGAQAGRCLPLAHVLAVLVLPPHCLHACRTCRSCISVTKLGSLESSHLYPTCLVQGPRPGADT